ncbi:hypothetical protein ES332_A01G210800v1 [Gossypium tomentosum]|uniref:Uncharacterized protein n=1 Tax=Gossypium tomentosum TaxID=34277 RepID=A0A5D2RW97_GOSTO|nr:hypothetical protein ES332_A01G210800v1 [Gossypium tomentosum]
MPSENISTISFPFPELSFAPVVVHRIPRKVQHTPVQIRLPLPLSPLESLNLPPNSLPKDMQGPPLQNS